MRITMKKATTITFATAALLVGGAGVAATSASAAALQGTGGATAAAGSGCPSGAVCIYPGVGLNGGHPEPNGIYYSYGPHNLVNQFGYHTIYNNQTGGAGSKLCTGSGGGGTCTNTARGVGEYAPYDLTPINSIVLVR